MPVVLDASVAAGWFLGDERTPQTDALLDRVMTDGAYVPALFIWEMQNVLLSAERADRISPGDADLALEVLRDLPIRIDPPGDHPAPGAELHLARHYDLTPYDAAYLAVASSRHLALATADTALARAARDLGIDALDA
jgi:predicted nucleic acid-binding protein